MASTSAEVRPYLTRAKNWKIRNMVALYIEARQKFRNYQHSLRQGEFPSFEKLREICEILFEIKDEYHLVYKKLLDPQKKKFENGRKFTPGSVEIEFMNNVGLLFHKLMAARELKYVMEHYVEKNDTFQKNAESMEWHMGRISTFFDDGIGILTSMIKKNKDNILLLTFFLENSSQTKKHFEKNTRDILMQFAGKKDLAEVFYKAGKYYFDCGWNDRAKKMFKAALKENATHKRSRARLRSLG